MEVLWMGNLLRKTEREVWRLFNVLGVDHEDDLKYVKAAMLVSAEVPPVKAEKLIEHWTEQGFVQDDYQQERRPRLADEFYKEKYQRPASQALKPFLLEKENLLRDSGYPEGLWARKFALVVQIKDKPELTELISKANTWDEAKNIFLTKAQAETFRQDAATRLKNLTCDGKDLNDFCRNYRKLYDLAGLDNGSLPEEQLKEQRSRDVSDLLNCLDGDVAKQALHLKEERFKPESVGALLEILQTWVPTLRGKKRKRHEKGEERHESQKSEASGKDQRPRVKPQTGPAEKVKCFKCQKMGHYKSNCPDKE